MTLSDITHGELQSAISHLREALHSHQLWHRTIIRTLTCNLPVDQRDLRPAAYTECAFGQWYYSNRISESLRNHPGFIAMGREHQKLHEQTIALLRAADAGESISTQLYDNFDHALEGLQLEISALERELEDSLFNRDSLTGAISRLNILPALREQQELIKRLAQRCYVAMVDLDDFKVINDEYGHLAGDRVLTAAAQYFIRHLRPYDKVFRYGGEEFLLCLPHAEMELSYDRIDGLRAGLSALEIDIGENRTVHISASVGLTLLEPDAPVETSIDHADQALYVAKSAGKNCVRMWDATMQDAPGSS